jgi:SAM-dependent methyltransferase
VRIPVAWDGHANQSTGQIDPAQVAPLLRDRFENSLHTDVIGALLEPRGARVLEVRSRAGSILDGLRRAWGAEVYAMPIWESQQQLLRDVYGIETSELIDFDRFSIPFEGEFDLIICNHLITHAVRLGEFLAEVRRKLKPGGHIYLHNEPDDAEFLAGTQSMLATLNPLHLQAFDDLSLVRVLTGDTLLRGPSSLTPGERETIAAECSSPPAWNPLLACRQTSSPWKTLPGTPGAARWPCRMRRPRPASHGSRGRGGRGCTPARPSAPPTATAGRRPARSTPPPRARG